MVSNDSQTTIAMEFHNEGVVCTESKRKLSYVSTSFFWIEQPIMSDSIFLFWIKFAQNNLSNTKEDKWSLNSFKFTNALYCRHLTSIEKCEHHGKWPWDIIIQERKINDRKGDIVPLSSFLVDNLFNFLNIKTQKD